MKQSASLVLAERIRQRKAVTPAKRTVRKVKFSSAEMAYDPPAAVTDQWIPVRRGTDGFFAKPTKEEIMTHQKKLAAEKNAKLEPDVRKAFPDDKALNQLLKQFIRLAKNGAAVGTRKKSA
jgi:hypothetical protein